MEAASYVPEIYCIENFIKVRFGTVFQDPVTYGIMVDESEEEQNETQLNPTIMCYMVTKDHKAMANSLHKTFNPLAGLHKPVFWFRILHFTKNHLYKLNCRSTTLKAIKQIQKPFYLP